MQKVKSLASIGLLILIVLWTVDYFDISYPVTLTTTSRSSELSVVGEGKVDVSPDTAYVDVGIQVDNAATVQAAEQSITEKNNKIIAAMKALGLSEENLKTSNFSIYPNYSYDNGKNTPIGFSGNVTIAIKTKDLDLTPKIIQEATNAGANQIQGTRFTVDEPQVYREQARQKAIDNAKAEAEKLASSLGIRLGKIVNIVESTPSGIYPYEKSYADVAMGGSRQAPVPDLEPGTQTITSTVTLFFEKR